LESAANERAIKRVAEPADLAGAVLFLSGEDSGFITGQTLLVNGGTTFGWPIPKHMSSVVGRSDPRLDTTCCSVAGRTSASGTARPAGDPVALEGLLPDLRLASTAPLVWLPHMTLPDRRGWRWSEPCPVPAGVGASWPGWSPGAGFHKLGFVTADHTWHWPRSSSPRASPGSIVSIRSWPWLRKTTGSTRPSYAFSVGLEPVIEVM
jgi:hypothetical protein